MQVLLHLNEMSGGLGKTSAVSIKFLNTMFLASKLLGWKVSVKGIPSSLFETDG